MYEMCIRDRSWRTVRMENYSGTRALPIKGTEAGFVSQFTVSDFLSCVVVKSDYCVIFSAELYYLTLLLLSLIHI